jgi:radical SAM protein with 4Fe4S-binding SPASM domain
MAGDLSDTVGYPIRMVEIETRTICNRRCSYCPNSDHSRPDAEMPEPLFVSIIAQLSDLGFDGRMSFHFYNEPLLDDRLERFVAQACAALPEMRVVLYSNGDLLTRARFEALLAAGVETLWITNHGRSAAHCRWRHELPPDLRRHLRYQTKDNPEIFWTNRGGLLPHVAHVDAPLAVPCTALATSLVVDAHGHVVLCYEDYEGRVTLGNLQRQSIEEVWNSPRARTLRRRLLRGDRTCTAPCRGCNNVEMQTLEAVD